MTVFAIEKLARHHRVDGFDCGQEALDRFLARFTLASQQANASQTYVGLAEDTVVGYYTLVVAEVACDDAPDRLAKGLVRHPIPLMLLARLAVASVWKDRGIGSGLLKDAMKRTLQAADIAGICAFAVHAKNETARAFYAQLGLVASPTDSLHLFMLTRDLRRAAEPH